MTEDALAKIAPLPTVRRLPAYLSLLRRLKAEGCEVVSGTRVADELGLEPIQVRKDLAYTGIVGKPGVGFEVVTLIQKIEAFLGWDNATDAFLVGAGSLGTALMGYEGFQKYGLNIVAAFDNNPAKVGRNVHGKQVLPMDKLANLIQRMHVHLAIIAVPSEAAQQVADQMVEAGVKAIWNFAPTSLKVPPTVIVQNAELSSELAVLSVMLAHARRKSLMAETPEPPDCHPPSCSSSDE